MTPYEEILHTLMLNHLHFFQDDIEYAIIDTIEMGIPDPTTQASSSDS
jgi:hypothetical protein